MDYYTEILNDLEKLLADGQYDDALFMIRSELRMPYVPPDFKEKLEEMEKRIPRSDEHTVKVPDEEKIRELLKGDAESQMYAVYSLTNQNLRKHKVLIDDVFSSDILPQAKDILIYALIEQEISEEFTLNKNGLEYRFVPRYCLLPEESDGYQEAVKQLKEIYLHEPSLYQFAIDLLQEKCFSHLPLSYEAEESGQLVEAITGELAKMFGTEIK
ncbi:MAG: DUF3196 family protein [Erysipelotrichaceae bacterium]|nr:DUF3196 family protein [Erysipelotrichaceae bacterium]MBQ1512537.1 DUF3196 family protein [Erysipelotrichaceae bacterium]MBQ1810657.1 DUF3196 family protein [Erysipelotrichaceae bacterium]MBQ5756099.1 DUF3196 family protein [Erysipelotrichaceae bacterium]